jgi:hypothetical protein
VHMTVHGFLKRSPRLWQTLGGLSTHYFGSAR